jgi:Txe/YoeB family toxin of toxin-antitoxin system
MVKWNLKFNKQADKDAEKLKAAGLKDKTSKILDLIESNPFIIPPPYEPLTGQLKGFFSRMVNKQHRIVYTISEKTKEVYVYKMFRHYQD